MITTHITFHNAKTRFGHTILRCPLLCLRCGAQAKLIIEWTDRPGLPRVGRDVSPKFCGEIGCGHRLGCWKILKSWSEGSARRFDHDENHTKRYRTRKEAAAAKRALGL